MAFAGTPDPATFQAETATAAWRPSHVTTMLSLLNDQQGHHPWHYQTLVWGFLFPRS
jgi:hypothetical protein